jgi:hypothetical protein
MTLKLEPIIARFVDDVLEAVRNASLDEVREALAPEGTPARAPLRVVPIAGLTPPRPAGSRRGARNGKGRGKPAATADAELLPVSIASHEAPALGDISDPAALLEAAVAAYGAPAAYEWLLSAPADDNEPPESTVLPIGGAHEHHISHSASASRARSRA